MTSGNSRTAPSITPATAAKKVSAELPAPAERHDTILRTGTRSRPASQGVRERRAVSSVSARAEGSSESTICCHQWAEPIRGGTVQHDFIRAGAAVVEQALRHRRGGTCGSPLLQPLRRQYVDRLLHPLAHFLVGSLLTLDIEESRICQQPLQRRR